MKKVVGRRQVFERVKRAVVGIGFVSGEKNVALKILGSGVCIDSDGLILTAAHVIKDMEQILPANQPPRVFFIDEDSTGTQIRGVVARAFHGDDGPDIGVLTLEHDPKTPGYPAADVQAACDVWDGEEVALCGFPFGAGLHQGVTLTPSFRRAMVSAILPNSRVPVDKRTRIQLDALVHPGNSGGPIFRTTDGKVVGVVIQAINTSHSVSGLDTDEHGKHKPTRIDIPIGFGLAVPISYAAPFTAAARGLMTSSS